jgi:cellulose synthase/poly-beta-1,6-N-acetylglucosamine synthase-like glycosyltransferase
MEITVNLILIAAAALVALPTFVLFVECVAALLPPRRLCSLAAGEQRATLAVLVPAHDEAVGIARTITNLRGQLAADDRLLVVADNCADATAQVAREAGAAVLERHDPGCRGKGYALAFGMEHLRTQGQPPAIVVVVDADCELVPGALDELRRRVQVSGGPVQAEYLLQAPSSAGVIAQVSSFAFLFKIRARSAGRERMGWPCHMLGTGMALPWPAVAHLNLATGNVVEDMQMGIDLVLAGYPTRYEPRARVLSATPAKTDAVRSQRTRWEHGHLGTILAQTPRLLWGGVRRGRLAPLLLALDLVVPPLSLLVLLLLAVSAAAATAAWAGWSWWPAGISMSALALLGASVLLSWARFARREIPFMTLLSIPFYILWKIPVYVLFVLRLHKRWVLTERDAPHIPHPPPAGARPGL